MLSHAIEVLGWTLLHFVWQEAVVGVLAAAMLLALRRRSANARYLTAVSALSLMLLLPLGTIAWLERVPLPEDIAPIVMTTPAIEMPFAREMDISPLDELPINVERIEFENSPRAAAVPLAAVAETKPTRLEEVSEKRAVFDVEAFFKPFVPWAVGAWLIGVGVLSLRLFASWLSVLRLRRRAIQSASANWQALLGRLAERLRVTPPVRLVESALVEVPAVIGWLRPVILLPASAVTGLTTEQLEALLAHELAHVRRHDYLINLLQTVVETLLFYHPAVWWVSHRIRLEREHCCDDLAASVCGDRLSYAKALVAMEELRVPKLGLAMSSSGGSLRTRVARLIGETEQQRRPTGSFAVLLALVSLAVAGTLAAGLLTPPQKPTEGLPNDTQPTPTKSTDTNEETPGPTQRRGQETRAEREAENDINIRFAKKSAEVAWAEWEKMVQANHKVPGSIPPTEIERAIRNYEKAVLQIERAEREQRIHQLELELALGQNKDDGLELTHKTLELRWLRAKAAADLAKVAHDKIIDANRRLPGTIPEAEVAKAQMADEAARAQLERAQLELQIAAELKKSTEMAFTDTPLTDAMTFLSDYHNIPVELDATAKKFGDSPVTVNLTCADLAEGLMLVLHPHPLSYCIDGGRLLIATPEEVQRLGHRLPRSFAEELTVLRKADDRIDWKPLLRGEGSEFDVAVVIPKLAKLLDSDDATVQRSAARGLALFHFAAALGRPGLEKLTKSKDTRVARAAWITLVSIGREDFSTLPLLLAELDRNGEVFGRLWLTLLKQFDEQVWVELTKVFPSSSPTVRATLASSIRLHQNSSLPVGLLALDDPDPRVRRTALRNIHRKEPPAKLLSALQARMKDSEHDIRLTAAQCLLSFETADAVALELLLSEVEQSDPGRSLVALQNFLLMAPKGMRPTINALDQPSRVGTDARKFAARRALAILAVRDNQWADGSTWGPTRAGLRTRLSLILSETPDGKPLAPRVGQPIKLQLELTNIGKEPFEYDAQQAGVNQSLTVLDPDGRPVKYIGLQSQTAGKTKTIQPRETHVIVETLDLTAQYDIQRPGTYLIQWTRGSSDIKPDDITTPFVPNSSVLTLEVQEAEGNGDKPAAKEGDQRSNAAAGSGDPRRAQATKRNSVRERLQNRISLSFENVPLRQVVENIGREAKITVRLESDSLENEGIGDDTPLSISVDDISTASALQLLLQPIQLSYLIENETLVVTTAARVAKTPVELQLLDLGKTLADEAKMSLLRDAIQTFVEPKGWDIAGGPGSIRFNASREEFVVRHVPFIQHEVDRFLRHVLSRRISPEMQRLRKLLAQRFTLELGEVTLLDAVRKIAMTADANVMLDADGLETAGVRSNRRVTLNHKDTPLRDILDGLCKPLKLRFRIWNEVIQITDEETAQGGFVAVLYPVSTPANDLANRIQSIRPESWKSAGGQGTIEPHRPTNSLIIRQHDDVHDEIEQFFAKLVPVLKPAPQLKGQVRWIDQSKGMVWVNLGHADGVARPMTFQVREKEDPKNGNQPPVVKGKIEVTRLIDGHTSEARIILDDQNNAVAKGDEVVQLFETTQTNDKPIEEQRKLPPPKGEVYDAARPRNDRVKPNRESGAVSGAISGIRRERDPKMFGQFSGRVRLKTEKPLPDLEKVVVPAGKLLDESLVFSKDGGLANVVVYLQKPTFPIEPPPSNKPPKPFVLIAEEGKFWPHVAFVRVGRPVVFENRQTERVNFRLGPLKNVSFNVLVTMQDHVKLQAFRYSENIPFAIKCDIQPWMQAHVLTLDHPFAAVTDEDGRFTIDGLPQGEHEFRVWHERVGYLEKSLVVAIKPGQESRSDLEYEPKHLKLEEAEVQNWSQRQIDSVRNPIPLPRVPRVPVQAPKDKAKLESPDPRAGRGSPDPAPKPTAGLPDAASHAQAGEKNKTEGDLRRAQEADAANRRIREELKRLTEVEFTATPLSDVAIFLGDYHNISVTFDASAKERVKKLDVPITVTVSGEDLATTLPRILHSVRLSYFVDDGKLQIATPEEVQKRGHPVPESLADVLAKLQKADASMPWERFLLGNATGLPSTSVANATNLEKLTKLLAHADVVVQRHAARSLFCFEKAATPARAALEKLTKSEDRAVRRAAWWALLAIGHEDLSTWPLFLAAWIEGDDVVRSDWFPILAQFDPKVFEKLTALFPTASVGIRQSLASSIRVRGRDDVTEPLALLAFEDADRTVRYIALIASHHEHSESLTAGLRKRLQDEHPPCRVRAADCLLPSSDDRTAAVDVLLSELSRENSSEKDAILSIFANHGRSHGASPIRDLLLRRSVSANEAERIAARRALKVVPEETQTAGVLKHIDLIFEIRKNEPKLSAEQRVQAVDDEMQYLLMTNNPSEEQRARVNHRAAHQFANWDIRQHFALVKKYSEAGLKLDVDPARRASLFSLLGSAALVAPAATTFAEQRRNAAKLWLTGYREVESLKLPKSAPELPVVEKLADVAGESPEQQAAREQQHATQLETRQQAEYTRQMIEHRHQLAHLLVETFRREPADEPELRKLATEALTERSLVEALLTEGAVPLGAAPGNSRPQ